METRIEKMSLETLGAVERERERVCLTNSYVNCLLKQASFSSAQKYENVINRFNRDSEKSIKFLCCFLLSFLICCKIITGLDCVNTYSCEIITILDGVKLH